MSLDSSFLSASQRIVHSGLTLAPLGRVRGPGQIGMLISICDEGCEAGGAEGRANEKDDIGYWQVAARQEEELVWRSAWGNVHDARP